MNLAHGGWYCDISWFSWWLGLTEARCGLWMNLKWRGLVTPPFIKRNTHTPNALPLPSAPKMPNLLLQIPFPMVLTSGVSNPESPAVFCSVPLPTRALAVSSVDFTHLNWNHHYSWSGCSRCEDSVNVVSEAAICTCVCDLDRGWRRSGGGELLYVLLLSKLLSQKNQNKKVVDGKGACRY